MLDSFFINLLVQVSLKIRIGQSHAKKQKKNQIVSCTYNKLAAPIGKGQGWMNSNVAGPDLTLELINRSVSANQRT